MTKSGREQRETNAVDSMRLIPLLRNAVIGRDRTACEDLTAAALEAGLDAGSILTDGLAAAMEEVGGRYDRGECFVPELLLASDCYRAALELLKPVLERRRVTPVGRLAIGVAAGDIHEIGKNLVKILFEASGWEVHDLGKDVSPRRFAEAQGDLAPDVVGVSALMTSSMMGIPEMVEAVRGVEPRARILAGGASVTADIARRFGADGYARNGAAAVTEAVRLLNSGRTAEGTD